MKNLLNKLKRIWMSFAQKLGKVNTIVLLSLIYLIVVGFMSLIAGILRKDPLRKKMNLKQSSFWIDRISSEQIIERQKYQF